MSINLTTHAVEKSVYGITVSFFDSAGASVAPKTLTWSLTDTEGAVINSLKDVVISTPASTETIVLKGDDLQMIDQAKGKEARLLIISATYDDAVLGNDCPLREEICFVVENRREAV